MVRETWNWIVGLLCIVLVAIIWIAASFVVQSVVDSGISPFLISYICNSLFIVYIPMVELSWWIGRRKSTEGVVAQSSEASDFEEAQLVEASASSADDKMRIITLELPEDDSDEVGVSEKKSGSGSVALWSRRDTARVSLLICPIWFFAQLTFNLSLKYTTVTSNTILSSTSTLFTFLVSLAFLGEKFAALKLVGVILCMAGTVLVAFGDAEGASKEHAPHPVLGDAFCLLSAMLYACYTTLIRKKFPDESSGEGTVSTALFLGYLGLFNALIFLPVVIILHFTGVEPIHRLSSRQFSLIVGKGLFDNVLSDYLWAEAVLLTTTTVATAGLTLQVPIAAVVDTLRGHAPGTLNVLGAISVIVGFFGLNQPADCFHAKVYDAVPAAS